MFTLTLPSNASPIDHPDNSVATFKTTLADPVDLSGTSEYEIGISEIQHPTLIANIKDCWLSFKTLGENSPKEILEEGLYTSDSDFFSVLSKAIARISAKCSIVIGKHNRLVTIWMQGKGRLSMSQRLADVLGYRDNELVNNTDDRKSFSSNQAYDINRGLDHIFVYCNLCSNQVLGHTKTPLLRCIKSNIGSAPKAQCTTFSDIAFKPMSVKNFCCILVYLRLSNGNPVPFMSGTAIVTLVIRRKNRLLFQ